MFEELRDSLETPFPIPPETRRPSEEREEENLEAVQEEKAEVQPPKLLPWASLSIPPDTVLSALSPPKCPHLLKGVSAPIPPQSEKNSGEGGGEGLVLCPLFPTQRSP